MRSSASPFIQASGYSGSMVFAATPAGRSRARGGCGGRRAASADVRFYSDTVKLRSLARLDMARELRGRDCQPRDRHPLVGRHDLRTGRVVAWVGYMRCGEHRLRGDIRPNEFLRSG